MPATSNNNGTVQSDENEDPEEYGVWNIYDANCILELQKKEIASKSQTDIWPNWCDGVPNKLRRTLWNDSFYRDGVHHRSRSSTDTLKLRWKSAYPLTSLEQDQWLLPRDAESCWSGVYRLFAREKSIARCCGVDPTGTLYIGCAGSRGANWSTLRTRVKEVLKQKHSATLKWWLSEALKREYTWDLLSIEWAYTQKRYNFRGDLIQEARMAESWLLACYADSFGELPPLNEKR
jgi:hypothetical protein